MPHEVFRVRELKQKLSCKVECIATAENLLFLGTGDGKLMVFEVSTENYTAQCVHIHSSKHKQPIRMIIPIVEKEILLTLAGDVIVVHRLYHMSHKHLDQLPEDRLPEMGTLKGVKDIISLHLKRHKNLFSMAVLQRKKINIYEYRDHVEEFVLVKDCLLLPDGAKTVLWIGKNLMIGFRRDYVVMDVATGVTESLYSASRSGPPLMVSFDPVPEVLLGEESCGVRALHDGSIVPGRSSMPWHSLPVSVAYAYPFLITTHDDDNNNNCIEVRVPFLSTLQDSSKNPALCQSIGIRCVDRISQRPYADFDARVPTRETQHDALRKDIIIAINSSGNNTMYLLELVPVQEQVITLASNKCFEAALLLCQLCVNEVDEETVENLKTQFALWNFTVKRDYKAAMLRFYDAKVDPLLVINLFPGFLTQRALEQWRPPKGLVDALDTTDHVNHVREAVVAFLDYAIPLRREISATGTQDVLLEAVDTAIMKAYVTLGEEKQLLKFLGETNACLLTESEGFLADNKQWVPLIALWHYHGLHCKSLKLLYILGVTGEGGVDVDVASSSPSAGGTASTTVDKTMLSSNAEFLSVLQPLLPESLADLATGTGVCGSATGRSEGDESEIFTPQTVLSKLLEVAAVGMEESQISFLLGRVVGVVTTIRYVRSLSLDEEDTLECVGRYARWVLANVSPRWAVMMFSVARMHPCRHATVLRLLSSDMSDIGPIRSHERAFEWLSAVFGNDCNACGNATMHNAYWKSLGHLVLVDPGTEEQKDTVWRRQRLCDFLRSSHHMDIAEGKAYLEQPHIRRHAYIERGIIYERLKLHEDAIRMFLYEAERLQDAQNYVARVSPDGEDSFCILLRLLLSPGDASAAPRLDDAITMVNTCECADPLSALLMLPDNTPVTNILGFLRRSFRDASTRTLSGEIYANVLETRVRQAELTLMRERSRRVVMDLGTCCAVCEKKLRLDTVFARFPNGVVVHQACMDDDHVCPVTRRDFRRGFEPATRRLL